MLSPHQQGFDGDSQTCLSIGINYLSAFAFEQGVIGIMSFPNSTAAGTPFARMPIIHAIQQNIIIEAPLLKDLFELVKRNTHNGSVESLSSRLEFFESFDGNVSIKPLGDSDYLLDDLPQISSDEIPLIILNPFEFLFRANGLEFCPSLHYLLSLNPDVLSEIGLIENLAIGRNNANGKMFGININAENVPSLFDFFFFGQISNDLKVGSQAKGLANPPIFNQILKSPIVPVLLNRNCNSFFRIQTKTNEEIGLCAECFAVSGNIKFDSNRFDFLAFASDYIPFNIADNLTIKGGIFLAN